MMILSRQDIMLEVSDNPVEQDKLSKILEVGRHVPTVEKRQPQRIVIIKSHDAHAKINSVRLIILLSL